MTKDDLISYYLDEAEEDWQTAQGLFGLKRYHHALFFCHLTLEKLLKGLVFKATGKHAPPIHGLLKLAKETGLDISENLQSELDEITTWNIRARYDSVKREFYKKATRDFTTDWLGRAERIYIWLKKHY